nr:ribonuclease HII [Candidatus Woesearchaeota archaeon]
MVNICGIDEAGRGPVIGPLVICGVMVKEEKIGKLKDIKVKDSKLLSSKQREDLFDKIKKIADKILIIEIQPKEIDEALESDSLNLNWLEAVKTAEILNKLKPNKAIIDCPSPNIKKYEEYLRNLLDNKNLEILLRHNAEVYEVVAAASILAKVTRDREIEKLQKKYGNFGPGYPSNPITQKFLKENWDKYPGLFRKTWVSWKNHNNMKNQKKIEEF